MNHQLDARTGIREALPTVQPKIVKKRYSEEGMFYHHSYSTTD